eukprot:UN26653
MKKKQNRDTLRRNETWRDHAYLATSDIDPSKSKSPRTKSPSANLPSPNPALIQPPSKYKSNEKGAISDKSRPTSRRQQADVLFRFFDTSSFGGNIDNLPIIDTQSDESTEKSVILKRKILKPF